MRWKILILLGVFLVSFVSASSTSDVQTAYHISGCDFVFEGEDISITAGECSKGDMEGHFYCDDTEFGWVTTEIGRGCSRGETTYTPGTACCPEGYWCNETSSEWFICTRDTRNCNASMSEGECEAVDIDGYYYNGVCICDRGDYDCGIYDDETDCNADFLNLGQTGIGTELCGTTITCNDGTNYLIREENCSCVWYDSAPAGKECQVELVGMQSLFDDIDDREIFSCSNVYEAGECIEGEQEINWSSTSSIENGFLGLPGVPDDCLGLLGCDGGDATRQCGEPIIKLFGFSLFSLFASLFIIGMYYAGCGRFK